MDRLFFLLVIFLFSIFNAFVVLALTPETREKIELGMTLEEVENILERKGELMPFPSLPENQQMYRWKHGKSWVAITLVDQKVGAITSSNDLATSAQKDALRRYDSN